MKKTYLIPALEEQKLHTEQIIAGSIAGITGLPENAGIDLGGPDEIGLDAQIKQFLPMDFGF